MDTTHNINTINSSTKPTFELREEEAHVARLVCLHARHPHAVFKGSIGLCVSASAVQLIVVPLSLVLWS